MTKFNEFQRVAIRAYADGDLAYLLDGDGTDTQDVGDGLFTFILRELGDDDMDIDLAIQRMNTVRDDINTVLQALSRFSAPRRRKSTVVKSREPKEGRVQLDEQDRALMLRALDDFEFSADGKRATVTSEVSVEVTRPANDCFCVVLKFPSGASFEARFRRKQMLEDLDIWAKESGPTGHSLQ
jgi:hypothetical protein